MYKVQPVPYKSCLILPGGELIEFTKEQEPDTLVTVDNYEELNGGVSE